MLQKKSEIPFMLNSKHHGLPLPPLPPLPLMGVVVLSVVPPVVTGVVAPRLVATSGTLVETTVLGLGLGLGLTVGFGLVLRVGLGFGFGL